MSAEWHHIDVGGKVLGRVATDISKLLLAKHRVDAARNVVAPVYVVVTNSDAIELTGKKEEQKKYYWHTGYPGGIKERSVKDQRGRDSRKLIEWAVSGMLPKNSLRKKRLAHLRIYPGKDHPHKAQFHEK